MVRVDLGDFVGKVVFKCRDDTLNAGVSSLGDIERSTLEMRNTIESLGISVKRQSDIVYANRKVYITNGGRIISEWQTTCFGVEKGRGNVFRKWRRTQEDEDWDGTW